jgi:hypothetical protein
VIGTAELVALEDDVRRAVRTGSDAGLRVLGYGEISLVIGFPAGQPRAACKRLPAFASAAHAARYEAVFERYLEALRQRGLTVAPSALHTVPASDGTVTGYVVQPILPAEHLAPAVLRTSPPDADHPVVRAVVDHVVAAVDETVGLDAQLSNWVHADDGRLTYLDVTTPILRGPDGRSALDVDVFLAPFPWAMRAPLRRFVVPSILARYHDRRSVLLDVAANLLKERLDPWLPAVVTAANRVLGTAPLTVEEVRKDYVSDARQWETLLRLRRADRWWQQTVRRREYPFLLPGRIER